MLSVVSALIWIRGIRARIGPLWHPTELFARTITENSCAGEDVTAHDGNVYDTDRIFYAR